MNTFAELLANPQAEPPDEVQRRARSGLVKRLRQSDLHPWTPQALSQPGMVAVIGVASYSPRDLALLDELEELIKQRRLQSFHVAVFDCLDCQSPQDFERYLPGTPPVLQTPVLGIWQRGELVCRAVGVEDIKEALVNLLPRSSLGGVTANV